MFILGAFIMLFGVSVFVIALLWEMFDNEEGIDD
jgi:hypothetical protein